MSRDEHHVNDDDFFRDSLDRILASSSSSCSTSDSDPDDLSADANYAHPPHLRCRFPTPRFPMSAYKYDVWISEPASVSDRRSSLLKELGLSGDPALTRSKPDPVGRSVSSDHLIKRHAVSPIQRSKSDGVEQHSSSAASSPTLSPEITAADNDNSSVDKSKLDRENSSVSLSPPLTTSKPPLSGRNSRHCDNDDEIRVEAAECDLSGEASEVCMIRNLDNGKEFVVNEIREDGMWNKLKEVGTGKQLTMEEFEISVGHSPIVQELMRRQNVEDESRKLGNSNVGLDSNGNNVGGGAPKMKKHGGGGSWFKSIKSVASSVTGGHKERRSSDERDTSSEKGGRRSSSATDDSQDVSFHGPERVRVRQYGKACKELTAVFKTQEIQAHNGSIWSIKFSLDGKYLASAGEDCVIHIWQVMETERKGELLMQKSEDNNLDLLFVANGSSEPSSVSPNSYSHLEKKRRGRTSISHKSLSLEHYVIPETMFALSEKPISSFQGHVDDVLDLSWSKSQHLLSSSMDKTVRLWHLSSKTCLRKFSHTDYVTCIQFNPVDDNYFISGSLDAKVRIWSIHDHQVVDWNDTHEMVTAACYTPDGQGALVGTYKGSCRLFDTSDTKLQEKHQINLQNKKKKSHHKKITGFQFAPGSSSEVLVTSADSRIRVVDGLDLVHKFKGFRNTNSQISASLTANGKYVVSASEDSHVYIWRHEADFRPNRSKSVTVTRSYEHFHSHNVSVAVSWPGVGDSWGLQDGEQNGLGLDTNLDEVSTANHPPTPVEEANNKDGSRSASGCTNSPLHGTITSASNSYFFDRISATYPEEKLLLATTKRSPHGKTNASFKDSTLFGVSFSENLKADFTSVALSCKRLQASEGSNSGHGRLLDVLVCNAAVYQPTAKELSYTADGFELSVGTNHLGHFLLARLMLEDLNKSDYPSRRLIIVASITGNTNTLAGNVPPKANLGDLRGLAGGVNGINSSAMIDGGDFDGAKAYKDSKVCNMLTMQEFHRRNHEETGVTFASLYPGCIVTTGLFREHIPLFRLLFPPFQKYITKGYVSEEESGKRLAQVVSDPSLTKSGEYWSWNKTSASFENQLSEEASDAEKARKLWEVDEKLVGLA